jgi:uncharacterized transporter YbjL
MSQPDLESVSMPSVINKKPRYDVYFVMLVISLVALLMGCIFLLLEIYSYGGLGAYSGALTSVTPSLSDFNATHWV